MSRHEAQVIDTAEHGETRPDTAAYAEQGRTRHNAERRATRTERSATRTERGPHKPQPAAITPDRFRVDAV
jgi:hypothetical protein